MSWGGRWQKGLSHQACVASDSERAKTRPLRAAGSAPALSLPGPPGPGLTAGEGGIAPRYSPRPIPCSELPRSWGGRRLGESQVLSQK